VAQPGLLDESAFLLGFVSLLASWLQISSIESLIGFPSSAAGKRRVASSASRNRFHWRNQQNFNARFFCFGSKLASAGMTNQVFCKSLPAFLERWSIYAPYSRISDQSQLAKPAVDKGPDIPRTA
jgi:hypothetical protein